MTVVEAVDGPWPLVPRCITRAAIAKTSSVVYTTLDLNVMLEMEASRDNDFVCQALGIAGEVFFVHDRFLGDTLRIRARPDFEEVGEKAA